MGIYFKWVSEKHISKCVTEQAGYSFSLCNLLTPGYIPHYHFLFSQVVNTLSCTKYKFQLFFALTVLFFLTSLLEYNSFTMVC